MDSDGWVPNEVWDAAKDAHRGLRMMSGLRLRGRLKQTVMG